MEASSRPMLLLLALACAAAAQGTGGSQIKYDKCYGCICEGASRCNRQLGCSGGVCGLFQITRQYWADAGAPTLRGDRDAVEQAFQRCATDIFCSLRTVYNYMQRYSKDCDGDGQVNCYDLAMLHQLGPSCQGQLSDDFKAEFDNCQYQVLFMGSDS